MPSNKEAFNISEEEYMQGEPFNEDNRDLPSTFMAEEDIATGTNVVIIPSMKINLDLILEQYMELCCRARTKDDLKFELMKIWGHAATYGSLSERTEKLLEDVEMLEMDIEAMNKGYSFELELSDDDYGDEEDLC